MTCKVNCIVWNLSSVKLFLMFSPAISEGFIRLFYASTNISLERVHQSASVTSAATGKSFDFNFTLSVSFLFGCWFQAVRLVTRLDVLCNTDSETGVSHTPGNPSPCRSPESCSFKMKNEHVCLSLELYTLAAGYVYARYLIDISWY